MLPLSQFAETLSGLVGDHNLAEDGAIQNIIDQMTDAGIDISAIQGLGADQVFEMLNQSGVDLSEFSPDQITTALQELNVGDINLENMTQHIDMQSIAQSIFNR